MRRNRRRKSLNIEDESNNLLYISIAVVIIAIIAFTVTYIIYSNTLKKEDNLGELTSQIKEIVAIPEDISETSNPIGKSVNESIETYEENTSENEVEKVAVNISNIVKENESNNKINEVAITTSETTKKEEKQDPTFIKPVNGDIIKEFSSDGLLYSETLKEWTAHNGIDIKADSKTVVKSSSEGTIKSIKNDPRYGITVIIEHANGFISIYSNLMTAEFVKEGEQVKQGQTIGTVGNTAIFEIADESHLHFEILKDNKYLNPSEYIK